MNHPVCHRHPRKSLRELGAGPWGARTTRLRRPRIAPLVSQRIPVHRIPLHVRDDRDTPLTGAERAERNHNLRKNESELFLRRGLARSDHLDALWESRIFAHEIFVCRRSERCGEIGTDLPGGCRTSPRGERAHLRGRHDGVTALAPIRASLSGFRRSACQRGGGRARFAARRGEHRPAARRRLLSCPRRETDRAGS